MDHWERSGDAVTPPAHPGGSPWTAEEFEALHTELTRDVAQLQLEIDAADEAVRAVQHGDCVLTVGDAATARAALERLRVRREEACSLRAQALAALERLRADTFGLCGCCGEGIGKTRVSALPYAELCIDCRRQYEHGLRAVS